LNYYNEFEPFASKWLKQLIVDGLIPPGDVDDRSIADVKSSDLSGYTQCHFFAGIGGWSRALEIAQWDADRPVWTGSPPCQSFSVAGKGKGKDDERHLWPVFFNLIRECQPPAVFGEQVAAAIRHGWLDDLQSDFEAEGYASGACVLPSGSIGAYHKRDRLFFTAKRVADTDTIGHERSWKLGRSSCAKKDKNWKASTLVKSCANNLSVADPIDQGSQRGLQGRSDSQRQVIGGRFGRSCSVNSMADPTSDGFSQGSSSESSKRTKSEQEGCEVRDDASDGCNIKSVGNSEHSGSHEAEIGRSTGPGKAEGGMLEFERPDSLFWGSSEVIYCRDGKHRPIPVESALFPLANGIPNRVGILRGAGNAIVPQAAAEIIKAVM